MEYASPESEEIETLEEIRKSLEQFEVLDIAGMMAHFAVREETGNEV